VETSMSDELLARRALRRVTRGAVHQAVAVARLLLRRYNRARPREIGATTLPTLNLAALSDAHRRLLAAPPETEICTQDPGALSAVLGLLLPFPVDVADLRSEGLRLVGGRPIAVLGVMVAALHYDWEGARVSLFQVGARTFASTALRRVLSRSDSFFVEKSGSLSSVAWSSGRTNGVIVAESVPAHHLVQLACRARESRKRR
jgi:anti-sigma factor RsiW